MMDDAEDELEQFTSSPEYHVVTAIKHLPRIRRRDTTHTRRLNTKVTNFRGSREKIREIDHINHLRSH